MGCCLRLRRWAAAVLLAAALARLPQPAEAFLGAGQHRVVAPQHWKGIPLPPTHYDARRRLVQSPPRGRPRRANADETPPSITTSITTSTTNPPESTTPTLFVSTPAALTTKATSPLTDGGSPAGLGLLALCSVPLVWGTYVSSSATTTITVGVRSPCGGRETPLTCTFPASPLALLTTYL